MAEHNGPLSGIKIIDLSTAIAAPFATGMLADQGADVIKVEAPGIGDIARYVGASRNGVFSLFHMSNRGKRSIALNLKEPRAIEILKKLLADADVLIHNFRIGAMEKLGLGYEQLKTEFPQLIYTSVYGFGHSGPKANKRAYDNVIQCFAGVADMQADVKTGEPIYAFQAIADKLTSMTACQAITAALLARATRDCGGQHIKLSMVDSVIAFLWMDASGTATFLEEGANIGPPVAKGNRLMEFKNGWGCCAPVSNSEFFGVCRAFGVDCSDPRVSTAMDRAMNTEVMAEIMNKVQDNARAIDVDEAIAMMEAEDVPCAKAMALADLPEHPQIIANGTFVESVHPVAGRIREPRPPAEFEKTHAAVAGPSPSLGEHTEQILTELGLADEIETLRSGNCIQ